MRIGHPDRARAAGGVDAGPTAIRVSEDSYFAARRSEPLIDLKVREPGVRKLAG